MHAFWTAGESWTTQREPMQQSVQHFLLCLTAKMDAVQKCGVYNHLCQSLQSLNIVLQVITQQLK